MAFILPVTTLESGLREGFFTILTAIALENFSIRLSDKVTELRMFLIFYLAMGAFLGHVQGLKQIPRQIHGLEIFFNI